jgi:hypothetical protein
MTTKQTVRIFVVPLGARFSVHTVVQNGDSKEGGGYIQDAGCERTVQHKLCQVKQDITQCMTQHGSLQARYVCVWENFKGLFEGGPKMQAAVSYRKFNLKKWAENISLVNR